MAYRNHSVGTGTDDTGEGTIPTGTTTGDRMLAFIVHNSSSATILTPPGGWDLQEADPNPADFSLWCYQRAWQSGDGNPTWTFSATGNWVVVIASYSNDVVDVDIGEAAASATAIDLGNITPTVNDVLLVGFVSIDATTGPHGWTQSGAMTERGDQVDNQQYWSLADEQLSGGSGVPVGRTFTQDGTAQDIGGFFLALKPQSAGTTLTINISPETAYTTGVRIYP